MLNRVQVWQAFTQSTPQLQANLAAREDRASRIRDVWQSLQALQHAETQAQLEAGEDPWTGARTTPDVDKHAGFCVSFDQTWTSRKEAQAWAHDQLKDQAVVAVDGSQLPPERGMSMLIGAVQIGYYYNDPLARRFAEAQEFALILPEGPTVDAARQDQELGFGQQIAQQRFVRECAKLLELAQELDHIPVCFFDNTFIVSYIQHLDPDNARVHLDTVQAMLAASRAGQTPIVGYVDTSYSRDLTHMLDILEPGLLETPMTDAALLHGLLPHWGDRTPFLQCARKDAVSREQPASFYYADVGFVYMRTDRQSHPTRIEVPMWVYEAGRLEEVLNVVRAQCIYGDFHYPSALALADRNAVLTRQDRAQFYDWLKHYMNAELDYRVHRAAKANSKRMTRPAV